MLQIHTEKLFFQQVGGESPEILGTIPPASGVTAGAFVVEYEAEGKVVVAGEVEVEEVQFLVSQHVSSGFPSTHTLNIVLLPLRSL